MGLGARVVKARLASRLPICSTSVAVWCRRMAARGQAASVTRSMVHRKVYWFGSVVLLALVLTNSYESSVVPTALHRLFRFHPAMNRRAILGRPLRGLWRSKCFTTLRIARVPVPTRALARRFTGLVPQAESRGFESWGWGFGGENARLGGFGGPRRFGLRRSGGPRRGGDECRP
jgi:hypothetical protein